MVPHRRPLAAWSLVHGFIMLWLNHAVGARVRTTDPIATVQRIATILFNDWRPQGRA